MLKNYFKIAIRTLVKHRGYALINILGLAIGLTCFILISLLVRFELSYDGFHDKSDQIYRIVRDIPGKDFLGSNLWTASPAPLDAALVEEFPEVESATKLSKASALIQKDQAGFFENGIFTTNTFFDVFTFPLVHGDATSALRDPGAIVLTRSLAEKHFGDANPVGQTLLVSLDGEHFNGINAMTVTGVVEDVPANSHFTFSFLVPVSSSRENVNYIDRWDSNSYLTYLTLAKGQGPDALTEKLGVINTKHVLQERYYQENPDKIEQFLLQPLGDIHLYSDVNGEFSVGGDGRYVFLFSFIALMILLIACINYINLATARASTRAMEVGVRKVMGAQKRQLIGQFMSEALVPALIALAIAIQLVVVLLPTFGELTARALTLDVTNNSLFLFTLVLIGLCVGILAGSYPALMMSRFSSVGMMKGILKNRKSKTDLRNALVVVQFTISIMLIIGTVVIQRQLHYMQNAQIGVDREQVVVIEIKDRELYRQYEPLKETLERFPHIRAVTAAQTNPTSIDAATLVQNEYVPAEEGVMVYRSAIQPGYIDLFGIEMLEGRTFDAARATDEASALIINETMMHQLGWETAIGKYLPFRGREEIVGVMKDFNFHSFRQQVAPLVLYLETDWWFPYQKMFVKAGTQNMPETIAFLQETMAAFSPAYPFDYYFLDDAYNQLYQTETRLGKLLNYFTVLALCIAFMGLLGLATFTVQQRTKEIGVRKVLGASLIDILLMLSQDFTRLVVVAFVLAAPVGYFVLRGWLDGFAYRIPLGVGTFVLAGLSVLVLTWLTVGYQSLSAALANPVSSLRHD
ncbi:MAG: ABC transporter permease [Bacteroidota bacterium]